ncbi:hypothetical protein CWATWH0401_3251 [Crocosphaera watsonii WH 0401]|uniref:Uncharacterized protein n=1 Tax=Crocosphaera watsonii WH 0401 TaxID=555881 RepID=T2JD17_CROWT|nr:hypothetical protein CWATWH0401_3251 [Crocosphaera watsonii WH 0401]
MSTKKPIKITLESLVDKISDYGSIYFLSLTLPIKQLQLTVT